MERISSFPNLQGKRMFVTGATGFTGGHLARRMLELGYTTTLLVRPTGNPQVLEDFKKRGAVLASGDVKDAASVERAMQGADYVFHLAALYREAKHPDSSYFEVNLEGTRNVLEAAKKQGVKRVIHCSTCGVHSHIPNPPADESEPFRPGDVYQVSKCEAEKLARGYFEQGQPPGVLIRPAMIWGEGDKRILKLFRGVHRRCFPIIGSGQMLTHWIYVEDLVDAFLLAADRAEAAGQTYIIAGRSPVTLEQTVALLSKIAGVKPLPFKIPLAPVYGLAALVEKICVPLGLEPPLHRRRVDFFTKSRAYNTSKAQRELGFTPRFDLEEEARRIYTWYKEQGWLE
jgi:dihydroflavonol-4-reductase